MPHSLHRAARRSRRVLCWALGLVFVAQLTCGLVLDYAFPLCRFPQAKHVLRSLPGRPEKIDVVFMGSSRFVEGINSDEVRRILQLQCPSDRPWTVFNAATLAGDQIVANYLLRPLQKAGVQPRWLIVEVSPETLSQHTEWLSNHLLQILRWHELPSWANEICRGHLLVRLLGFRLAPLCYYRSHLRNMVGLDSELIDRFDVIGRLASPGPAVDATDRRPLDGNELLHVPQLEPSPEQRAHIELTTRTNMPARWLRDYRAQGRNVAALEQILRECKNRQIHVVLVGIPVTEPHRRLYTAAIETAYRSCLERLCQSYDCRFVNCRDWVPDALFNDNHHLGQQGKLCFSRLLALRVLVPLLQNYRGRTLECAYTLGASCKVPATLVSRSGSPR